MQRSHQHHQTAMLRGISSCSISSMQSRRLTVKRPAAAHDSQRHQELAPNHQLRQSKAADEPPAQRRTSRVREVIAQPTTALTALAGFAAVASQVAAPSHGAGAAQAAPLLLDPASASSEAAAAAAAAAAATPTSLLLQLDQAVHTYVASHTTLELRLLADVMVSDAAITAGIAGWLACTALCLAKAPSKTAGVLALCYAVYYATVGAVLHGDPPLVDLLKHAFARARPSTLHHSWSYPSGHTAAAVFAVGALLVVLLPLTMRVWGTTNSSSSSSGSGDNEAGADASTPRSSTSRAAGGAAAPPLFDVLEQAPGGGGLSDGALLLLWGAAWVSTAAGRILSESHWLSDTLAGGLLSVAAVSGLAWSSDWMLSQQQLSSGGGGGSGGDGGGGGGSSSRQQEQQ